MTTEQRQLIEELQAMEETADMRAKGILWRARQEISGLIEENERLHTSPKPH